MKATKLTVRRINKQSHLLPDECDGQDMLLFKLKNGKVIEQKLYHHFPTVMSCVFYDRYVILPKFLP